MRADPATAGLILVKYNLEREENQHYVQIANFLNAHGIRVPKIHFHDPAEGLIWIEDLGERDLCSYQHEKLAGSPLSKTRPRLISFASASGAREASTPATDPQIYADLRRFCLRAYLNLWITPTRKRMRR